MPEKFPSFHINIINIKNVERRWAKLSVLFGGVFVFCVCLPLNQMQFDLFPPLRNEAIDPKCCHGRLYWTILILYWITPVRNHLTPPKCVYNVTKAHNNYLMSGSNAFRLFNSKCLSCTLDLWLGRTGGLFNISKACINGLESVHTPRHKIRFMNFIINILSTSLAV